MSEVAERHQNLVYFSKSHPSTDNVYPVTGTNALDIVATVEHAIEEQRRKSENKKAVKEAAEAKSIADAVTSMSALFDSDVSANKAAPELAAIAGTSSAMIEIGDSLIENPGEFTDWDTLSEHEFPFLTGDQIEDVYVSTVAAKNLAPIQKNSLYFNCTMSLAGPSSSSTATPYTTKCIDDVLLVSNLNGSLDIVVTFIMDTSCFDCQVLEGDRIIAVNGVCIAGCPINAFLSLVNNHLVNYHKQETQKLLTSTKPKSNYEPIFTLTMAREKRVLSSSSSSSSSASASASMPSLKTLEVIHSRNDDDRKRPSAYVGVTWMDVPEQPFHLVVSYTTR